MSKKSAAEMLELSQILKLESTTDSVNDPDQIVDSETLLAEILQHVKETKRHNSTFFDHVFLKPRPPPITWTGRPRKIILLDILAANEIIENILRYVKHATLFKCRKVSDQFRALIDTSPTLQRCLFLLPDFSHTHPEPLRVLAAFPNGSGHTYMAKDHDDDDVLTRVDRKIHINIEAPDMIMPPHDPIWNRMLVTQPPIRTLGLYVSGTYHCQSVLPGGGGGSLSETLRIECETGVTLGLLYDALQSHIDFHNLNCASTCRSGKRKWIKTFGGTFTAEDNHFPRWGTPIELCERPSTGKRSNKRRRLE